MLHQTPGATIVNQTIKSVSAAKPPRERKSRGGRVVWKRLQDHGDELFRLGLITKETRSAITRFVLFKHLTPLEGEAAKRYAYVIARFEKYCTEGKRTTKSPSYQKAFGADQELERHFLNGTTADYEAAARKAKREYNRLMQAIAPYGPQTKSALDDFCCSDIEPAADFRTNLAVVLSRVAKRLGVTANPRKRK